MRSEWRVENEVPVLSVAILFGAKCSLPVGPGNEHLAPGVPLERFQPCYSSTHDMFRWNIYALNNIDWALCHFSLAIAPCPLSIVHCPLSIVHSPNPLCMRVLLRILVNEPAYIVVIGILNQVCF